MKQLLLITLLMVSTITIAQVGINTTSPKATLDITASNSSSPTATDGILIPRISNFPITNPTAEQQSMLVYLNTARTGVNISGTPQDYSVGFYYWDHTIPNWVSVVPEVSADWKTTGNNDAISGTHFIGTTNNQEVDFRVNNKFVGRLTEMGQFELQSDELSLFIGFEAGEAYDPDSTSAEHNTFIGYQTGKTTSSGRDNTAVGTLSLTKNTTGDFNTAVGDETLENNTFGSRNTAVGNDALRQNTSGGNNTAIGQTSLASNLSGINNTAIGINAGLTNQTGSNNVFIGVNSDANSTSSNLSIAIGRNAIISGSSATAIGHEASATANEAIAIGDNTIVDGGSSSGVAIGDNTIVDGGSSSAVAIGKNSTVDGGSDESVVLGIGSIINNGASSSIALGNNNTIAGGAKNAVALGSNITIDNGYDNAVGIGNGAVPTKANQLKYGSITEIDQGTATIVNTSDGRFKYDIKANVPGLDFINRLRPVTYKFDLAKLDAFHNAQTIRENPTKIETGFIAQEIEEAMIASDYDFSGLVKPEDLTKDNYKVSYVTFVVPLVQAVQEQQKVIDSQNEKIDALEAHLKKLESLIEGLK
ncbi:tail fiber domain-containing protein [uncultured Dokdonia sp.]|uniref:tail fiber domain-containing protein n=1 Tax=uncultured Dokdonia sp. TaxID=575653 RepID=UPI002616E29B|nr:tail fiber domain-containing protein [uncultured Dokdonia sp.]